MYESFFGLRARPFQLSPDSEFFYASKTHSKGLAYLHYGINQGEGFVVVTGIPGTGKTTLLNTLMSQLPENRFLVAKLSNTLLDTTDLFRTISLLFGLKADGSSKVDLLRELEQYLVQQARAGRKVLLLIDEAHNLSPQLLEELRLLSNFQFHDKFILQTFLLGQQQLEDTLNLPGMLQLRQRVLVSHRLEPILRNEIGEYIEHRLKTCGWQGTPEFSPNSLILVHHYSDGIPRQINTLCDRVLLYACMEEICSIDEIVIENVVDELRLEPASYVHGRQFTTPDMTATPPASQDQAEMDFARDVTKEQVLSTSYALKKAFYALEQAPENYANNILPWPPNVRPAEPRISDSTMTQTRSPAYAGGQQALAECLEEVPGHMTEENIETSVGLSLEPEELEPPEVQNESDSGGIEVAEKLSTADGINERTSGAPVNSNLRRGRYYAVAATILLLPIFWFALQALQNRGSDKASMLSDNRQLPSVIVSGIDTTNFESETDERLAREESVYRQSFDEPESVERIDIEKKNDDLLLEDDDSLEQPVQVLASGDIRESEIERVSFSALEVDAVTELPKTVSKETPKKTSVKIVAKGEQVAVVTQPVVSQVKVKEAAKIKEKPVVSVEKTLPVDKEQTSEVTVEPHAVASTTEVRGTANVEKKQAVKSDDKIVNSVSVAVDVVDNMVIADSALSDILARFRDAYQAGDLESFVRLFSDDVDANDVKNVESLADEYEKLFDYTEQREIVITDVLWEKEAGTARGNGVFRVSVKEKGGNKPMVYEGNIKLIVESGTEQVPADMRITTLHYSYND
ncbi:MAG: AAA family ATPase [Gammaproteobacteria bacterium]|nr:AAA family ATPase [Gammaproteobacteria bacterium]